MRQSATLSLIDLAAAAAADPGFRLEAAYGPVVPDDTQPAPQVAAGPITAPGPITVPGPARD